MVKKRQILTITSIAVISFLIGTMFNLSFLAMSSDGTNDYGVPFDKIWEAIKDMNQTIEDLETQIPDAKNTTKITIVIEMGTDVAFISFNGMSILELYTYNITAGRPILRYDRGFNIMMNQITISTADYVGEHFRIEIPVRVLISNTTISMEVYNDGGSSNDLTTITFYNSDGELAASFTKYAYSAPPPLRTETFYIASNDLL